MKTAKPLRIAVLSLAIFAIPLTGHCQTYTLSTPISGSMTMGMQDATGPAGSYGNINLNFTKLTETIYLDPVAQTIRQIGMISYIPTASNISFQETQQVPGIFPNPPTNAVGNVTVTLAPAGGVLQFDTGAQPVTWSGPVGGYTFDGSMRNLGTVNGSYSLRTGGQTYSGDFSYQLPVYSIAGLTFSVLSTTGYPNSLALSGLGTQWGFTANYVPTPGTVVDMTANNGFHMMLDVGAPNYLAPGDEELFNWSSPGTITATLVPEPTSLSLAALGALTLLGGCRLRRQNWRIL